MNPQTETFWQDFLSKQPSPEDTQSRLYEAFSIGGSPESADEGAALITSGRKTATSALLWEYEGSGMPIPKVGSLSVLLDGRNEPVCVVETSELEIKPLNEVEASFARDYGEWGDSLESWQQGSWKYYEAQCHSLGKTPAPDMPLVCERFRVIYP